MTATLPLQAAQAAEQIPLPFSCSITRLTLSFFFFNGIFFSPYFHKPVFHCPRIKTDRLSCWFAVVFEREGNFKPLKVFQSKLRSRFVWVFSLKQYRSFSGGLSPVNSDHRSDNQILYSVNSRCALRNSNAIQSMSWRKLKEEKSLSQ